MNNQLTEVPKGYLGKIVPILNQVGKVTQSISPNHKEKTWSMDGNPFLVEIKAEGREAEWQGMEVVPYVVEERREWLDNLMR